MWKPRMMRKHYDRLSADAARRLDTAEAERDRAGEAARRSEEVARRSRELLVANSIAAAIVTSLRPPGGNGGNHRAS